jgi:hypothetical protein
MFRISTKGVMAPAVAYPALHYQDVKKPARSKRCPKKRTYRSDILNILSFLFGFTAVKSLRGAEPFIL